MKQFKVTGLNKRNGCEYRNEFETLAEAEFWYNKVAQREAVKFVTLYDRKAEKNVKMQGC